MVKNQLVISGILAVSSVFCCYQASAQIENVCFTPSQRCAPLIITAIDEAKKSLYVQAYQLTSKPIAEALIEAKNRGLDVQIILDKSQLNAKNSQYFALLKAKIPVYIDRKVAIAHNKVIIIDGDRIATGSYNFTANAENKNAENLMVIYDQTVAAKYTANFELRKGVSQLRSLTDEEAKINKINTDCGKLPYDERDFCKKFRMQMRDVKA